MPRTKQVKIQVANPKESIGSTKEDEIASNIEDFHNIYEQKKAEFLEAKNAALSAQQLRMKQQRLSIPVSLMRQTMKDLEQCNSFSNSIWNNFSVMASHSTVNVNNFHKTSDEGYLTSESSGGTSGRRRISRSSSARRSQDPVSTRTSRSQARKSNRVSRSVSRTLQTKTVAPAKKKNSLAVSQPKNNFKTPQNTKTIDTFAMVTPKVKPNTPHVVYRRPQIGEMAISLQGSPLATTSIVSETTANVNIPLPDGRLINIVPMKGLRPSQIPDLDAETQQQLERLKENIEMMCQYRRK